MVFNIRLGLLGLRIPRKVSGFSALGLGLRALEPEAHSPEGR